MQGHCQPQAKGGAQVRRVAPTGHRPPLQCSATHAPPALPCPAPTFCCHTPLGCSCSKEPRCGLLGSSCAIAQPVTPEPAGTVLTLHTRYAFVCTTSGDDGAGVAAQQRAPRLRCARPHALLHPSSHSALQAVGTCWLPPSFCGTQSP